MRAKLTPAQYELLREIDRRPQRVVSSYKPAHRLAALGFATLVDEAPPFAIRVSITPAGRLELGTPAPADRSEGGR